VGKHCGEALVLRRGLLLVMYRKGAVKHETLVVGEWLWRRRGYAVTVMLVSPLGWRHLVGARRALCKGTPASRRAAMVAVIHCRSGRVQ
jgi:hypothetical protein